MKDKEIKAVVKHIEKQKAKNPKFKVFIASKFGNNDKGKGVNRSVLLATHDGITWFQYYKVWGKDNEKIAKEIINSLIK
jgi:hypothetical protein